MNHYKLRNKRLSAALVSSAYDTPQCKTCRHWIGCCGYAEYLEYAYGDTETMSYFTEDDYCQYEAIAEDWVPKECINNIEAALDFYVDEALEQYDIDAVWYCNKTTPCTSCKVFSCQYNRYNNVN